MFRSNLDGTSENFTPFLSGLNMFGLQDMYLDTSTLSPQSNMPPPPGSVSSATLSPPTTPLTPEPTPFGSPTQFPLLADNNNLNMNATMLGSTAGALQNTLLLQRQYQYHYHLLLQQKQQQLALAQQQLALAASAAAGKDEIAHSLKMFALLTAYNADYAKGSTQDVMQEFAANGYVSDEFNSFQYCNPNVMTAQSAAATTAAAPPPPPQRHLAPGNSAAHWLSFNNQWEHLNNVWRNMSCNVPLANIATNSNNNNNNHNKALGVNVPADQYVRNKLHKRHNNCKAKEPGRHCVFCENNQEPEAVINSHTVRDVLGRVLCPKLRTYVCPICKASGDSAHTIKYCPKKPIVTMEDAIKAESFRLAKSNFYKQQMKV